MKYQGKHCRRGMGGKAFTAMLALTLVLAAYWAVGGTAAWLAAKSDPIASTFTFGDINITLTDEDPQEGQIKIIPGVDIPKDLKVTVKADSVDCWLFVKVEEYGTFVRDKVVYSIAEGWIKGDGSPIPEDVYYRQVNTATNDSTFSVLKDDKITVSKSLTKADIRNITDKSTLTFTAYAVQMEGINTAAEAWATIGSATAP